MKFFHEDSTVYNRAMQIWLVLIGMAHNRQTMTYGALARTLGYTSQGAQFVTRLLDPVMRYCQENNLPPLTVLVVNSETGKPGAGLSTLEDIDKGPGTGFQPRLVPHLSPNKGRIRGSSPEKT